MPQYHVMMRDGTAKRIEADSLGEARAKAAKMNRRLRDEHGIPRGPKPKCMMRGVSTSGETRYCQFPEGHKGFHSYHNEGVPPSMRE